MWHFEPSGYLPKKTIRILAENVILDWLYRLNQEVAASGGAWDTPYNWDNSDMSTGR